MARMLVFGLMLLCFVAAKPVIAPYGKPLPFFLGRPILFTDLEVTFDGGGASDGREYRAFRVVGKGKAVLVAWYVDQTKPVAFQVTGQSYQIQVVASSNPQADGALTVWKK